MGSSAELTRFEVLGPLTIVRAGGRVHIRSHRQRVILMMLLLATNTVVSVDALIDAVWAEAAPSTARNQVHICVSALRRRLGAGELISTTAAGYRIDVAPHQIDLRQFESWSADAHALARRGRLAEASALMRKAIGLWHGPLGSDVDSVAIRQRANRLDEDLIAAQDACVGWELSLGRHGELIGELTERVDENPLRERSREYLIVALCRAGRSAEALEVYRTGREESVEQLGLEPGDGLRRLEAQILSGGIDPVGRSVAPVAAPPEAPRQLPMDVADFTGRHQLLTQVRELLAGERMPLVALVGPAGVGKSAVAVRAAHALSDERYADGQLYADMHGTGGDPVDPGDVLHRFLRTLGVPEPPAGLEERAGLYRSKLAKRAMLVVLEDAGTEAQVLPLLPGGPACGVLVTSRTRLAGLPGVRMVEVAEPAEAEAVELLARIAGRDRARAEPTAARRLVEIVDRLPLGVRIIGSKLAARPHWSLRSMVARLAGERDRLDELSHGALTVRAGLHDAYDLVPGVERSLLQLLDRVGTDGFSAELGAKVLNVDRLVAAEMLEHLADVHLVRSSPGPHGVRYRVPELVRTFVREVVADDPRRAWGTARLNHGEGFDDTRADDGRTSVVVLR